MTEAQALFWLSYGMAAGSIAALALALRAFDEARDAQRQCRALVDEAEKNVADANKYLAESVDIADRTTASVRSVQEACALYSLGAREEALELLARVQAAPEKSGK